MRLNPEQKALVIGWINEGFSLEDINKKAGKFKPPFNITNRQLIYYKKAAKEQSVNALGIKQKHAIFIDYYFICGFNATEAYRRAYNTPNRSTARTRASLLLTKVNIKKEISRRLREQSLSSQKALKLMSDIAAGDLGEMIDITEDGASIEFNLTNAKNTGKTRLIKRIKQKKKIFFSREGDGSGQEEIELDIELYPADRAQREIIKVNHLADMEGGDNTISALPSIPAELISPAFLDVYRDILAKASSEYLIKGGRGSTKSSFISLAIIYLIINNPDFNAIALRNHTNTLRDSVYAQLYWAINILGLSDKFKCTVSPMEIKYIPTGQLIYFRGADRAEKLKGIIPRVGYVAILWAEELDQFRGQEALRNIFQTAIRGGKESYKFLSYNPPKSASNWVNKYAIIPKPGQYQHESDYTTVPVEWLGEPFINEAEHLLKVNPKAYKHEYKGIVTGTGGQVFDNIVLRDITDKEIARFDRVYHGLDWGFFPDPLDYGRMYYDAARKTLYLFTEYRAYKQKNEDSFKAIVKNGYNKKELLIADSAEPKSIADYKSYGARIIGAEKGPGSVDYSIKWLQSLTAIIIDPVRCPYAAEEFTAYELEQNKAGEFFTEYPDKNNHSIDRTRYALNLIWRRGGQ